MEKHSHHGARPLRPEIAPKLTALRRRQLEKLRTGARETVIMVLIRFFLKLPQSSHHKKEATLENKTMKSDSFVCDHFVLAMIDKRTSLAVFPLFFSLPARPMRLSTSFRRCRAKMTHAKAQRAPARACLPSPGPSGPSCLATPRLRFLGCI